MRLTFRTPCMYTALLGRHITFIMFFCAEVVNWKSAGILHCFLYKQGDEKPELHYVLICTMVRKGKKCSPPPLSFNPLNKWFQKIGLFFKSVFWINNGGQRSFHEWCVLLRLDFFYQLLVGYKITHVWNWELFFQSKAIATKLTATKFITTTTPCNRCQPISFRIKVRFFQSLTPATHARNCVLKKVVCRILE